MYTTKGINKNITTGYLTIGDPYRSSLADDGKSTRHKGKQMLTIPPKNTCNGVGYFDKKTYTSDPLQDKMTYLASQPFDARKAGFGSKDASRRDEFMSHVRTEQYRETLSKEMDIVDKQRREHCDSQQQQEQMDELDALTQQHTFPDGLQETKFLYDIGRSQTTEFNQKAHRDTFYIMRKGDAPVRRNNGPFVLSSESFGIGAEDVSNNRPTPKGASTKQFYDRSHLHT